MHGYLRGTGTLMHADGTSRRPQYEGGYEDGSPNDVVGYHQYLNLDLLISQSTY